jgi:hypothetical protein
MGKFYLEVSGQHHAPAALNLEKEPPLSMGTNLDDMGGEQS